MGMQARCEHRHVERAARVLATSRYSSGRARELYSLRQAPTVVPELIDLAEWRKLLAAGRRPSHSAPFTVLSVGRFYHRKRVDVLLRAAAILRPLIPDLNVRIVGNGPCAPLWHRLAGSLKLESTVTWLGDISRADLAAEYLGCDVFCLPSVQEGFGIVLLEAMAAGRPIVASRAAAIPEVAPHGLLVEPDRVDAIAEGIAELHRSPEKRAALAQAGTLWVEQFDAPRVSRLFLDAVNGCASGQSGQS
jgi:glycosyltransferase involved in cell wall biosynthesis